MVVNGLADKHFSILWNIGPWVITLCTEPTIMNFLMITLACQGFIIDSDAAEWELNKNEQFKKPRIRTRQSPPSDILLGYPGWPGQGDTNNQ
jgi:hypothetical protein